MDANIISVERRGSSKWSLRGSCYVGRAVIAGNVLKASEKVQGSFEALVHRIGLGSAKIIPAPAPISEDDRTASLLVSLFVRSVRRYLSGHKRLAYRQQSERGALVGGRLNVAGTAKLRARGMVHHAAFFRTILSADLPINHSIYGALMEVERLAALLPIDSADISSARALRMGMSECLSGAMTTPRTELVRVAIRESLAGANRPELAEVASLSAAILDSAGFGGESLWSQTVNRSWFVNLENMFERAMRLAVKDAMPGHEVVRATDRPPLFDIAHGRYRANPDIVIKAQGEVLAIGDAKYKNLDDWPSAGDVYELLAHAAAYGASRAFLIYPASPNRIIQKLGTSGTGCQIWSAAIQLNAIDADVCDLLSKLGLIYDSPEA